MIIVTGKILARPQSAGVVRAISLEHVKRSRKEPGCIAHDVSVDAENSNRFIFVELWADKESLARHFALESSKGFVAALADKVAAAPEIRIFGTNEMTMADFRPVA